LQTNRHGQFERRIVMDNEKISRSAAIGWWED